jgi:hypothetical protein
VQADPVYSPRWENSSFKNNFLNREGVLPIQHAHLTHASWNFTKEYLICRPTSQLAVQCSPTSQQDCGRRAGSHEEGIGRSRWEKMEELRWEGGRDEEKEGFDGALPFLEAWDTVIPTTRMRHRQR